MQRDEAFQEARKLAWALGLGFALIYLAFLPPGIYSVDENSMLAVAESLVTRHSIAVTSPELGIAGRDGQIYSTWYPLLSFLAAPLVAAASPLARSFHVPMHYVAAVLASALPAMCMAVTVGLVALLAVQLKSTLEGARRAALAFGIGTVALVYARTFYAEPLLALLATAAAYFVFRDANTDQRRGILASGVLSTLAMLAKPTGIVVGPLLSAYLLLKHRPWKEWVIPAAGSAIGFVIYAAYNFARFGNPLTFGPPYWFSVHNIPVGLAGLLASPGRGILWYCPPLILTLAAWRKARRSAPPETLVIGAFFFGYLGLQALWKSWEGGWSWGPRLMFPALPCAVALLGSLEQKWIRALAILTVAGFLVNVPNLVSFYERYYAEALEQGVPDSALLWSPARAPLVHAWGAAYRTVEEARKSDVREIFREGGTPSAKIESSRALRVVAVWWWVLPIAGIPRWIGAVVSLAMVLLGSQIIRRVTVPAVSRVR